LGASPTQFKRHGGCIILTSPQGSAWLCEDWRERHLGPVDGTFGMIFNGFSPLFSGTLLTFIWLIHEFF
jgi:hypothetical protein